MHTNVFLNLAYPMVWSLFLIMHANHKEIQKIYYTMSFLLHTFCYKHRPHSEVYIIGIWNGKLRSNYTEEKRQLYWEIYGICSNVNMGKTSYFIFLVWSVLKHSSWSLKTSFPFFYLLPFFSFSSYSWVKYWAVLWTSRYTKICTNAVS